ALPSVAGSRNSAAGVSRTTWVAVVAISHLLVPKYMLTTACRGTVSKACSPVASFWPYVSHFRSTLNSQHLDECGISSVWATLGQTLLKSLQERPINNQRQGYTLQPLPTASPRGQARDPRGT